MTAPPTCGNPCKGAFSHSMGIKGRNADSSGILFVLNRADSRLLQESLFNNTHLEAIMKSSTGKALKEILDYCRLSFDDVYITNLFKCLLPGDRIPTKKQYQSCVKLLDAQIADFEPQRIVAFGSKVYEFMFPEYAAKNNFEVLVMKALDFHGIPTFISNHPCKLNSIISKTRGSHYKAIDEFLKA